MPARLDHSAELRGRLRAVLGEAPLPAGRAFDFSVATGEAIASALEHAVSTDTIGVDVRYDSERIVVETHFRRSDVASAADSRPGSRAPTIRERARGRSAVSSRTSSRPVSRLSLSTRSKRPSQ